MSRVTLADVIATQERLIEAQRAQTDRLANMLAAALEALTTPRPRDPAAETFTIKRATVGEKVDVFETNLVRQDGETTEQMTERGMRLHERLCARYPLGDGRTHVWELDAGTDRSAHAHTAALDA